MDDAAMTLLHELRLRGVVEMGDHAGPGATLVAAGLAVRNRHSLSLTRKGRVADAVWARLAPGSEEEAHTRRAYDAFLPVNDEALRVCHDWQVRPGGIPNDHRDAAYDWAVIDRLRTLDGRCGPILRRLGERVARFTVYHPRLHEAVRRVGRGQHEWLLSPRHDSFHTVWMQLHEDLLLALGLERGEQPTRGEGSS